MRLGSAEAMWKTYFVFTVKEGFSSLVEQRCFSLGNSRTWTIQSYLRPICMGYPPPPPPHPNLPLSLWITHLEIFPERAFFVLCCGREEGVGGQLATYWLFQSPDPVVWLECITLLCTLATCQVSGWDKTGARTCLLGDRNSRSPSKSHSRSIPLDRQKSFLNFIAGNLCDPRGRI